MYKHRNLKVGDLVLLIDESVHRGNRRLGRVVECYQSDDGFVRQVSVRSRGVVCRRDVRKLCLLEADEAAVRPEDQDVERDRGAEVERGAVT